MIDEGYTKYHCDWRETPALRPELINELNIWRNRLYDAGLIGFYETHGVGYGNLSVRSHAGRQFIITGTGTGQVRRADARHYVRVTDYDIDDNRVVCEGPVPASSEALTHAAIYELDAGIGAVAHVHSPELWNQLMHRVPATAENVSYGTPDMAREFERLYRETDLCMTGVAVMAGHAEGVVAFGADMEQAAGRILGRLSPGPGEQ